MTAEAWWGDGAADRAGAASSALGRAQDATTAALGHLLQAGDVDWSGPGAAGYRDEVAAAVAAVRLLRRRLQDAQTAVAEHAAAVLTRSLLAPTGGWSPGLAPAGGDLGRGWPPPSGIRAPAPSPFGPRPADP